MAIDWAVIRQEHDQLVWSVAWRILKHDADALDVCQEVFAEAVDRSKRAPIENWPAFLRWLTTRRALDFARRRQRCENTIGDEQLGEVPHHQAVDQSLAYEELTEQVRAELTRCPEKQAMAFWLVCVEELTYREVADQMEISVNEIGVLVHRARQHLRQALPALRQSIGN